jgi:hypothetical protein
MADEVGVLGLISDTHGLLREEAVRALEGSDSSFMLATSASLRSSIG